MNTVCRDIFRAIHEGKWLSIEYKNERKEITKYWIGIISLNPLKKSMYVEGLHLGKYITKQLHVKIDSIQSSHVIEGSYFEPNRKLIDDIAQNPVKYKRVFDNVANLKILNYLVDCNKMDSVPYKTDYALIDSFDGEWTGNYKLSENQFRQILNKFQYKTQYEQVNKAIKQLAINELSINTSKGLYVLTYRKLRLDVAKRMLRQDDEITVCMEFALEKNKTEARFSIRKFLDADDYELLDDFDKNKELIKDKITKYNPQINGVDDMPYVIAIGRNVMVDLHKEYEAINKMYEDNEVTIPIKAFFGELLKQVDRRKNYPITLLDKRINLDQLLAIHNAMKYPLAYIQGPPGTGKTNTIVNTIVTAFFNEKTVLFASYNNHPIDGVCNKLQSIEYRNKGKIPFPIIRLGNDRCVLEALNYIKRLYEKTKNITIFDSTLEKNKDDKTKKTIELTKLLEKHEYKIELKEREEAILKMIDVNHHLTFQTELQGVQLAEVRDKLSKIGDITDEQALKLVEQDEEVFKKYLYYTSAKYIQRLREPKNQDLMAIVECEDEQKKVQQFNSYIRREENLKKFQRIFPIIATTSISAHKLGKPGTYFDMVIMDEASQGNIAMSLVPIIRGRSLMLVGDPQQLSPVILLNQTDNEKLKKIYGITSEYDYVENLIKVHGLDDTHIGKGTQLFLDAAEELGLNPIKMPKAIYEEKCIQCGQCAFGCPVDAKWTGKHFVDIAIENGAEFIDEAEITGLITEDNRIKGVKFIKNGKEEILHSDTVVLSAGAIGSALILRKIGIDAGRELFFDPFVSVGGVIKDINFNTEVQMAGLVAGKNFVLSPHYSSFIPSKIGGDAEPKDILSIMVKTSDECKGYITDDGDVVKINTINDIRYLAEGAAAAGFILEKAGVNPATIASTVYRGAHPGGSAAIGKFVDSNLETEIKGLFVDDASVLPISPGKPPILTILALSKRLADYLIG